MTVCPPCPPWPMLSGGHLTLDWAPCPRQSAHIGQWSRPKLPRLPPASCVRSPRSRPFLPLAHLPTVSSNIVAQARKLNIGVILLALAVNVSLRLILGYQIAYLGRKISSLHLILVVKWHFHDHKFFVPQKRPWLVHRAGGHILGRILGIMLRTRQLGHISGNTQHLQLYFQWVKVRVCFKEFNSILVFSSSVYVCECQWYLLRFGSR